MNDNKNNSHKLTIIDSHHHFWDLSMGKHPWLCDRPLINFRYGNYKKICKNFLVEDFKKVTKKFNVFKTIHMEAEWDPLDPIGEINWLEQLYTKYGLPNAAVGQIRLHEKNVGKILEKYQKSFLVRSVRQKPNYDDHTKTIVKLSDENFINGFKKLEKFNFHYDLQISWKYLSEAAMLAQCNPGITIILNHAGLPSDRSKFGIKNWKKAINLFSKYNNTAVKLSGIGVPNQKWNKESNYVIINSLIEKFGVDRCMFGSNFPVDSMCASYNEIVYTLLECTKSLTSNDVNKIFYKNALKYYNPI